MMSRTLLKWQVAVLAVGTAFSWTVLLFNYRAFFASGGRVVELSGCAVTNPVMTPCFYGALAFFIAFIWAIAILRAAPDAAPGRERGLQWLLIAGTLFAWGNLGYETYRFLQPHPAPSAFSCPTGEIAPNPLTTSCFYGAMLFLAALVVSVLILRKQR
jgi:hypothetical protein